MRLPALRHAITSIILSAPLVAGCTDVCSDNPGTYLDETLLDMPDAELTALIEACKTQQDCQPLCVEVHERKTGQALAELTECSLGVDVATGHDVVSFRAPLQCIGGRRPAGYQRARGCGPRVASYLAQQAELEAASVRAFADLHDDLRALGAPAALRRAAIAAAGDEVRHARTCERLARHHGATPARRALAAAPRRTRMQLALDNLVEGCVRETYGAVVAGYQGRTAADRSVRRAMRVIARDETRHATLSWRIHAWLAPQLSQAEREELAAAGRAARAELGRDLPDDRELSRILGVPDAAVAEALLAQLDTAVWAELQAR